MREVRSVLIVGSMALFALLTAEARTFELSAWRGETVAARVPDFCELGAAPGGFEMRVGVLKSVKYAPTPESVQRLECLDRVDWDSDDDGPRVVEIKVPASARPGVYDSGMMKLTVVDRVLPPPKDWKYYLDLWQHPWAVAREAKVKPFSSAHYKAMRPVYELLASAGQKAITVSLLEMPWDHQCYDAYHSMVEGDFELFDEYVEFCLDCGLGPNISCYSLSPWTLGKKIDADELEKRWGAFMDRFVKHLKEKGWYERTLMSMDEREPEDVKKVVDFVRRHAPGLRISMAGNRKPSDFEGVTVDIYSQLLAIPYVTPEFLAEAAARRRQGLVTTHYTCCGPVCPNTFLSSGPGEAFWCGVMPAMLGLDGYLRWAWNSWPRNPKKDASYGNWRSGDTFLCYPKGEPSLRFLDLRNGIIAAEKIRILREQGLFEKELAALAGRYNVKTAIENTCNFTALRRDTLALVNKEN